MHQARGGVKWTIYNNKKKTLCSVFFVTYLTIKMANHRDLPAEWVLKQAADMQLVLAVPLAAGRLAVQELKGLLQELQIGRAHV